jgi:thiosulfate/3-mercaptopyruvate sulfurtransferase
VLGIQSKRRRGDLVDVRSADEFTGKILAPPGLAETALRAGHIPGAVNIPWALAANDDGTFKSYDELKKLYEGKGVHGQDEAIAYCRIGERSSHTWFVLKYLLGYSKVRNYDGSWTEWGNLVGAPIVNLNAASLQAVPACQSA